MTDREPGDGIDPRCDSSPSQHASAHVRASGHQVTRSFGPGEAWFYDYRTEAVTGGPDLAPPQSRPGDQPAPGPARRVPDDRRDHIH